MAKILKIGNGEVGRLVCQPGRRRSNDVKPIAGPGDVTSLPSRQDAWVVGEEPVVVIDWFGASNYAKGP